MMMMILRSNSGCVTQEMKPEVMTDDDFDDNVLLKFGH